MNKPARECLQAQLTENIPQTEGKELIIYGMGNTARLYYEGIKRLEKEGFEISGYCSSNSRDGELFLDKPVYSLETLASKGNALALICTPTPAAIREISETLRDKGISYCHIDEAILKKHSGQVMECFDSLDSEISREVYADVVLSHIQGRYPMEESCAFGSQYFSVHPFRTGSASEVFVDCGAFVGDTLERYILNREGVFGKIIAFEPDKGNFAAMQKRVARLREEWNLSEEKIRLFMQGVSDSGGRVAFETLDSNNGFGSKFVAAESYQGGSDTPIISIDEAVTDKVSFLKADIESYEYKMLLGAKKTIQSCKPLLAVCIYHNAVDLYQIPLLIRELCGEYKMAVRHHTGVLSDTVLYCYTD